MKTQLTIVITKPQSDEQEDWEFIFNRHPIHNVSSIRIVGYTWDGSMSTVPEHLMLRFHNFTNNHRLLHFNNTNVADKKIQTRLDTRVPLFSVGGSDTHRAGEAGAAVFEAPTPSDVINFDQVFFSIEALSSGVYATYTDFTEFVITFELTHS